MTSFFNALTGLFRMSPLDVHERDSHYLAQATDLFDLERRMRALDSGKSGLYATGPYGIFMR